MVTTILSHAYKGALLSSLTTIRYTEPIDTIDQMVESGLPFYLPRGGMLEVLAKTDRRESVMKLNKRRVYIPFFGDWDEKNMTMYKYTISPNYLYPLHDLFFQG